MKKIIVAILIPFLLASCISIKRASGVPTQQSFATATLVLPTTQWNPTITSLPSETAILIPALTDTANCVNAAILLRDVTVLDHTQVEAGETFTKTWEFQNTGTCPWANYTIKFSSGDSMNAPLSAPVADTPPSGKVQVSMELTAPTADGSYAGYFTLNNSNGDVIPIGVEKTFWVKFVVGTYVAAPVTSGTYPTPSGDCIHSQNANYVSEIISLINAARANAGVQPVTFNSQIAAFAQSHSDDMAYNNFLSHDGSDGSYGERMRSYTMTYLGEPIGGEILAIGTPRDAMDQWRRDEHWDYVLRPHYTQIGVGYAYSSCSDYGGYFTVDFT